MGLLKQPNGLPFSRRECATASISKYQRSRARSGRLQRRVRRHVGLRLLELQSHSDLIITGCVAGAADHIGKFRARFSPHLET